MQLSSTLELRNGTGRQPADLKMFLDGDGGSLLTKRFALQQVYDEQLIQIEIIVPPCLLQWREANILCNSSDKAGTAAMSFRSTTRGPGPANF